MKILLVHPPLDGAEPPTRRTESLGLGYIAAVLRRDGHMVEILDGYLRCMSIKSLVREILTRDFDCLAITAMDVMKYNMISVVKAVKKRRKDATVVAGGYFPTFFAEQLLACCPETDIIVRGEGETVTSELFGKMSRGEDWRDTPGIAYLSEGHPVLNPLPPLIEDLDSLPFPARDELREVGEGMPALISSSRGCFHRCSFCSVGSFYSLSGTHAPRHRSPWNVLDEMEYIIAIAGIREFVFADDNFIGPGAKNKERVMRFADELERRNLNVTFTIESRVDEVDAMILGRLKEVGLTRVFLGVESGVQRQLDLYNKRITVEQSRHAIGALRELGIDVAAGFIMLDPYVTMDEVLQNMQFVRDEDLSDYQSKVTGLQCTTKLGLFGGVPLVERLRKDGLLREKGLTRDFVFRDPGFRFAYNLTYVLSLPLRLLSKLRGIREADNIRDRATRRAGNDISHL